MHNRKVFNNPEEFQPERYLKVGKLSSDVRDPEFAHAVFGFGVPCPASRAIHHHPERIIFDSANRGPRKSS